MTKNILYKNRRIALKWSIEELAEKSGINALEIKWFEEGRKIGTEKESIIKLALYQGFVNLDSKDHFRARLLEIALQINSEDLSTQEELNALSHMAIELGKLQGDLIGLFDRNYGK